MDEQGPDKEFEATEYDEDGNIKLPPPPIEAAKPKRPTVAGLKKELDVLIANIDDDVLRWIGEIDVRLGKIEEGSLSDRADVAADIAARHDNQDAAIGALADALRSHIEESAAATRSPETEIEFAQPPARTYDERTRTGDITGMANVCQHMTDVLLICRYLKEDPDMSDEDRNGILDIACRSSGVILAPGLQIRAGVKFTGA